LYIVFLVQIYNFKGIVKLVLAKIWKCN